MKGTYLSILKPNESKLVRGAELQKTRCEEYSDNRLTSFNSIKVEHNESNLNSTVEVPPFNLCYEF